MHPVHISPITRITGLTALLGVTLCLLACEQLSSGGDAASDTAADTVADTTPEDTTPAGPTTAVPSPTSVDLERKNNSNGSPESNADMCMTDGAARDPRKGIALRAGKPCIDSLIMRFTVSSDGSPTVGWSPNFTGATTTHGTVSGREIDGFPVDGTKVSVTLDTIPNLMTGGLRTRLAFDVQVGLKAGSNTFYMLTIEEVVITLI